MRALWLGLSLGLSWWLWGGLGCAPLLCDVDFECKAPTPHCRVGLCVECLRAADCPAGQSCLASGKCQAGPGEGVVASEGQGKEPRGERLQEPATRPEVASESASPDGGKDESPPEPRLREAPPERPSERPAPPEPRPACQDGQTRPCYTGKAGCTRKADGSYSCKGPCKAGTQSCQNQAWSKTCSGQKLPDDPRCDSVDRDCDGKPDECRPVVYNDRLLDYDINDSGHMVALTRLDANGNTKATLKIHCATSIFAKAIPKTTTIAVLDFNGPNKDRMLGARILAIPGKSGFLVAWARSRSQPSLSSTVMVRMVDVKCQVLPSPQWQVPHAQSFSMAVDGSGRSAFLVTDFRLVSGRYMSEGYLRLFDARGKETGSRALTTHPGCLFPGHVASNSKGQGVAACRKSARPFSLSLLRFSQPSTISPPLTVPNSSLSDGLFSYDPFLLPGINEKGDIAVQWQDPKLKKSFAYFRTLAGKTSSPSLAAVGGRAVTTATSYGLQTTARLGVMGDDFILQDMPPGTTGPGSWYRFSPDGKLLKKTSLPAFPSSLRVRGDFAHFLLPKSLHLFRIQNPF